MADNMPATILEALLFLWRRAAEGKDRRPLTVEEREMLDERDPGGTTSYYRFGVEIHDADGTPYVRGAWSHAMTWWFFQGRQFGIGLLVGEYARQEYSEFVGLNEKLQGVLNYLESPQLHLPVFWQHVLDRYPSLADEWSVPTDTQPPAPKHSEGSAAASEVEPKPITVTVAVQRYAVARATLRREVAKGTLRDLRPPGTAKNSPLLLVENQIASRWPRRS